MIIIFFSGQEKQTKKDFTVEIPNSGVAFYSFRLSELFFCVLQREAKGICLLLWHKSPLLSPKFISAELCYLILKAEKLLLLLPRLLAVEE